MAVPGNRMWRPQPQTCRLRFIPPPRLTLRQSQRPLWQRRNKTDLTSVADTTLAPSHSLVSTLNSCLFPLHRFLQQKHERRLVISLHCVGHNNFQLNGTSDGPIKSIVNKQYNSPVGIYSEETIAETLSAQAEVLAGGVLG